MQSKEEIVKCYNATSDNYTAKESNSRKKKIQSY